MVRKRRVEGENIVGLDLGEKPIKEEEEGEEGGGGGFKS